MHQRLQCRLWQAALHNSAPGPSIVGAEAAACVCSCTAHRRPCQAVLCRALGRLQLDLVVAAVMLVGVRAARKRPPRLLCLVQRRSTGVASFIQKNISFGIGLP